MGSSRDDDPANPASSSTVTSTTTSTITPSSPVASTTGGAAPASAATSTTAPTSSVTPATTSTTSPPAPPAPPAKTPEQIAAEQAEQARRDKIRMYFIEMHRGGMDLVRVGDLTDEEKAYFASPASGSAIAAGLPPPLREGRYNLKYTSEDKSLKQKVEKTMVLTVDSSGVMRHNVAFPYLETINALAKHGGNRVDLLSEIQNAAADFIDATRQRIRADTTGVGINVFTLKFPGYKDSPETIPLEEVYANMIAARGQKAMIHLDPDVQFRLKIASKRGTPAERVLAAEILKEHANIKQEYIENKQKIDNDPSPTPGSVRRTDAAIHQNNVEQLEKAERQVANIRNELNNFNNGGPGDLKDICNRLEGAIRKVDSCINKLGADMINSPPDTDTMKKKYEDRSAEAYRNVKEAEYELRVAKNKLTNPVDIDTVNSAITAIIPTVDAARDVAANATVNAAADPIAARTATLGSAVDDLVASKSACVADSSRDAAVTVVRDAHMVTTQLTQLNEEINNDDAQLNQDHLDAVLASAERGSEELSNMPAEVYQQLPSAQAPAADEPTPGGPGDDEPAVRREIHYDQLPPTREVNYGSLPEHESGRPSLESEDFVANIQTAKNEPIHAPLPTKEDLARITEAGKQAATAGKAAATQLAERIEQQAGHSGPSPSA